MFNFHPVCILSNRFISCLLLLNLSPTFNVTDHRILQMHLEYSYGVIGSALSSIKSYLSDQLQHVTVWKSNSEDEYQKDLSWDHASTVCTQNPLVRYVANMICFTTIMPDDTQVYIVILPKEIWLDVSKKLETCLADISTWTSVNMFKLSHEKTELIILNPEYKNRRITEDIQLQVGEKTVCIVESVKNLGVYLDLSLIMEKQVNAISKACYYHIHNIDSISSYLTRNAWKTLTHALITSKLAF